MKSEMSIVCGECGALKYKNEPPALCCSKGKVELPILDEPPQPLKDLLAGEHPNSKRFLRNIRFYNNAFAMTSFGATISRESNFMPTFKVQGQVHHRIGSLTSERSENARFLQIYFTGGQEAMLRATINPSLDRGVLEALQGMMHDNNPYIKSFKSALEKFPACSKGSKIVLSAEKRPTKEHARRFNLPEGNEVAIILKDEQHGKRDIVLESRESSLKFVSEYHRAYDALQYPLLFVRGEDGYHFSTKIRPSSEKNVTCMQFYSHLFMVRDERFNALVKCRDLYQQFAVDMFAKVQSERLLFIKTHQKQLRVESYIHLKDQLQSDRDPNDIGRACILPSSFTGSPRYMHEKTQDAMTYVRKFGKADLFITFTANPKWREVASELEEGQQPYDRQDVLARVFRLKLKNLMMVIVKFEAFGKVRCHMYTIEWQKRGLPHAHILIWLAEKIKCKDVDKVISAELPSPDEDPGLYQVVSTQTVHGPCGPLNPSSPCMKDGKCTKNFPKPFIEKTKFCEDGYPHYRRLSPAKGGLTTTIRGHRVDNRWVVPYNPLLSKTFRSHINVEFCNSVKSVKYITKYINKGSDAVMYAVENELDEVTKFELARYIGSNEAFWRIFRFPIHERHPSIQHLAVHLENGQRVTFTQENATEVAERPPKTTLTAFFELCKEDDFAKTLHYNEVPSFYCWVGKKWSRRKRGREVDGYPDVKEDDTIGRVYSINPKNSECFYLRLLLHEVKGPTSFADLRTVDEVVCETYHEACLELGLLADDKQWEKTLEEASIFHSAPRLRSLFSIILCHCRVSDPFALWNRFKDELSEDFHHQARAHEQANIYNMALIDMENRVIALGRRNLAYFGLYMSKSTFIQRL